MPLSTAYGNTMLAKYFSNVTTHYLALHTGDPRNVSTEVSGGGYARQSITWSTASTKNIVSTNGQTFHDLVGPITVTWFGVWDDPTATAQSHLVWYESIAGVAVANGGIFMALTGAIGFNL